MSNHLPTATRLLPSGDFSRMPEAEQATIALAYAAVAIAEQLATANRIALIAARQTAGAMWRDELSQISAELG